MESRHRIGATLRIRDRDKKGSAGKRWGYVGSLKADTIVKSDRKALRLGYAIQQHQAAGEEGN